MNSKMLVAAILGTVFLVSCGSQKNFNSRKYTKGNFHISSKRLKSDQSKQVHQEDVSYQTNETVTAEKIAVIRTNSNERTKQFQLDNASKDEPVNHLSENKEVYVSKAVSPEVERISDQRQKPRSQIAEVSVEKKAKKKNELSDDQRYARKSLIFGIIAISLMVALITIGFISLAPFGTPALFYLGRSIKAAVIPAIFGLGYGLFAKFGKSDLGKYKKHAKVGFWLSAATFLLWFLLI